MAYESVERLLSRRGEKVAAFMTVENAVGMALLAGPFFALGDLPLLLRAVAILLAAVLGFLITAETNGMMFCERVLWRVRGQVRVLMRGRTLKPEDLPGTRSLAHGHRAVARDGIVRKSRRARGPGQAAPAAPARPAQAPSAAMPALAEAARADHPA